MSDLESTGETSQAAEIGHGALRGVIQPKATGSRIPVLSETRRRPQG